MLNTKRNRKTAKRNKKTTKRKNKKTKKQKNKRKKGNWAGPYTTPGCAVARPHRPGWCIGAPTNILLHGYDSS
jgi:hypothetical protein